MRINYKWLKNNIRHNLYCLYDLCNQFNLDTPQCLIDTLDNIRYQEQETNWENDWEDEE